MGIFMEQSLQIYRVWSFYKACLTGKKVSSCKMQQGRYFFNLELCFPLAPIFDKCFLVPYNTEHLLNKKLDL